MSAAERLSRPEPEPVDHAILFEIARGFVGLRENEAILRHALLSLLGSCGVRFAAWLAPDRRGVFVLRAARGLTEEARGPEAELPLARAAERIFTSAPAAVAGSDLESLGAAFQRWASRLGVQCVVPLLRRERLAGLLALGPKLLGEPFAPRELLEVAEIAELTASALWPEGEKEPGDEPRAPGRSELDRLREQHPALRSIQGDGQATRAVFDEILALADFDLPVLIIGETGTGKELIARALHDLSPRSGHPFEAINCASIPPDLMPSALFGHERGAFTGAVSTTRGAFERAGEGTLFLDEIGDMPLETQANLLRVLQESRFRRIGGEATIPARARVISATNKDLVREAAAGRFRADLFYRLQMYTIRIPPLRQRREEIPVLVRHILSRQTGARRARPSPTPEFLKALAAMELLGNVRELESLVLGAVVRARGDLRLRVDHIPAPPAAAGPLEPDRAPSATGVLGCVGTAGQPVECAIPAPAERTAPGTDAASDAAPRPAPQPGAAPDATSRPDPEPIKTYEETEREYIRSILERTGGNKKQAAALMGIPRTTLNARMRKLGLDEG